MLAGVEAPAVTPTQPNRLRPGSGSSSAVSMKQVGQFFLHTSKSLAELELCFPPITTIASQRCDRSAASDWRIAVALHIVSKISAFVYTLLMFSKQFCHSETRKVVCATTQTGFLFSSGNFSVISRSCAASRKTWHSPAQCPRMPRTSGWAASPAISTAFPSSEAFETTAWIFATNGQVASQYRTPRRSSSSYTVRSTPWERMTSTAPGGTSERSPTIRTPRRFSRSSVWGLWMIGPSVQTRSPASSRRSTPSTARHTPKQNPADFAATTFNALPPAWR